MLLFFILPLVFSLSAGAFAGNTESVHLAVMDPLCKELSCPCVKGFAQRDYRALADFLSRKLGRPFELVACETFAEARRRTENKVDLVIGKQSVVRYQAARSHESVTPLAMLTDRKGKTTLTGLFIVRGNAPEKKLGDLKGRTVLFGPPECDEKYAAALDALKAAGVLPPSKPETRQGCDGTVLEVAEKKADAGVISSYAIQLLEGCGTIDKGSLRIVGETAPVPFIGAFATARLPAEVVDAIAAALLEVRKDQALKAKLESRNGFEAVSETPRR